ncbi:MAG TPA: hypothetical protein VFU26_04005 [Gaiellaceae bacterium]|nr:hypothetical protein [Gaiellaceae bacterium]
MPGSSPQKLAAVFLAAVCAAFAAAARADDAPPAVFGGHGVTFSYPLTWQHIDAQFTIQFGKPLWSEFFAPPAPAPPQPTDPAAQPPAAPGVLYDVVAITAFRLPVAITKKTVARYKSAIQAGVAQLAARGGGSLTSPASRVVVGGLPGYRFELTMQADETTMLQSRIVVVFKKKTEYFFNCQSVKDGPLAADVSGGCDQVTRSFRAGR